MSGLQVHSDVGLAWQAVPWGLPAITVGRVFLTALVDSYIDVCRADRATKTIRRYEGCRRTLERTKVRGRPALATSTEQVTKSWAIALRDTVTKANGPGQAAEVVKLLSAAWAYAAERDMVPREVLPFSGVRPPQRTTRLHFEPGWVSRFQKLIEDARDEGILSDDHANFLQLASATGMRPSELRRLEWQGIADEVILIGHSKGGPRTIPSELLGPLARAALDDQRDRRTGPWVFPSVRDPSRHVGEGFMGRAWSAFREFAAAEGLRMTAADGRAIGIKQATRHAFATFATGELGLTAGVVSSLLGNSGTTTVRFYQHLSVEHVRGPAEVIQRAMARERKMMTSQGIDPERLKQAIESISADDLAELGVSKHTIASYTKSGDSGRKPRPLVLVKICEHSGCDPNWLYGMTGTPPRGAR